MVLAALLAVEYRDRNTPVALTGNTPVGTLLYHLGHALFAPAGNPLDILDSLYSLILEVIHRAEPLFCGTEQDRLLAAPAVRILVTQLLGSQQMSALVDVLGNHLAGLISGQAGRESGFLGHTAFGIHRNWVTTIKSSIPCPGAV